MEGETLKSGREGTGQDGTTDRQTLELSKSNLTHCGCNIRLSVLARCQKIMLAFFQEAKLEQKIQVYQNLKPLELLESLRGRDGTTDRGWNYLNPI